MITLFPHQTLGHFENNWLDSRHHFSFGEYHDRNRMHFGSLRVINDDFIKKGSGFDPHPHRDMEIITYVRSGTIIHRDSLGNEGKTKAGDIQVMTAGTGIAHAEFADDHIDTTIFQIWIMPREKGLTPSWDQMLFPQEHVKNQLPLLASGRPQDHALINDGKALYFNQDASLFGGKMVKDTVLVQKLRGPVYAVISDGDVMINDTIMKKGDGAEITDLSEITVKALSDSEVILIEV